MKNVRRLACRLNCLPQCGLSTSLLLAHNLSIVPLQFLPLRPFLSILAPTLVVVTCRTENGSILPFPLWPNLKISILVTQRLTRFQPTFLIPVTSRFLSFKGHPINAMVRLRLHAVPLVNLDITT